MEVEIKGIIFPVEIIRKNNKNIYFRFKNNILTVTCNRLVTRNYLLKLIKSNEDALYKMYKKQEKKKDNNPGMKYLGKDLVIVYDSNIKNPLLESNILYIKDEKQFTKWEKAECFRIFQDRINTLLPLFTKIPKFELKIRKMKSRWGVNNVTKRIITLNSELLKKDITLIDYVIIHELCHFYEGNHSDKFWYQVGLRYPEYKLARKRLREE